MRGRNVSLFADAIAGSMLLISRANVPLDRLPEWIESLSSVIPLTHGIEAAREIATGATVSEPRGLMLTEIGIGLTYLIVGLGLVRLFEYEGRRSATLETF